MHTNEISNTFYSEHTDDPNTWRSPRPDWDVAKFNKRLETAFGCVGSVPRFRLRWAGEHDEYIIEDYDTIEGYVYQDENKKEVFVSCNDVDYEFPDGAIAVPHYENHKVFTPRWVIEEYKEPFYRKLWFVELLERTGYESGRVDMLSHYREPSERDIELLRAYVHKVATLTLADIKAGRERLELADRAEKMARREEFIDDFAEETARALTDGIPNSEKFYPTQTAINIRDHSKQLIKEHNKK